MIGMITVEKILQDRTMVSLTLMLVIATISASIQQVSGDVQLFLERLISHPVSVTFFLQSLPATPYFKMIDIWLFFTMNLMVVSNLGRTRSRKRLPQVLCLIFHTYLEYVIQTVEQREKRCQQDRITSGYKSTEYYVQH